MTISMSEAMAMVPVVSPDQARDMVGQGALLIDVRERHEVAMTGKLADAVNIPLGVVDTVADARSPAHDPVFTPDRTIILYCAAGARSALAGVTLQALGYEQVYNLGGFQAIAASGYPLDDN